MEYVKSVNQKEMLVTQRDIGLLVMCDNVHIFDVEFANCWGSIIIRAESKDKAMEKIKIREKEWFAEGDYTYRGTLDDHDGFWKFVECA